MSKKWYSQSDNRWSEEELLQFLQETFESLEEASKLEDSPDEYDCKYRLNDLEFLILKSLRNILANLNHPKYVSPDQVLQKMEEVINETSTI